MSKHAREVLESMPGCTLTEYSVEEDGGGITGLRLELGAGREFFDVLISVKKNYPYLEIVRKNLREE